MNEGEAKTEVWTKEEIAAIRDQARQFLAESGTSRQTLAKAIDWSPASVSRWLTDDYTGDSATIARAVASFLARQEEKAASPPVDGPFAMTRQAAEILPVLNYAHVHSTMGVIVGPSGNGKTAALKHYAAENAGAVLFSVHPANHSMSEIIHQLFELLGKPGGGRGTLGGLVKRLTAKLAGSGRLLIIDEAQFLDHQTVEVLRAIHDSARIGLVFCGMPRLYRDLVGNTVELWEQIRTRVGIKKRVSPFTAEDAGLILRALDPRVTPEVCRLAWEIGQARGRGVTHLYHHAARAAAAQRRPVTPADLLAAQAFLYEAPAPATVKAIPSPSPLPTGEGHRAAAPAPAPARARAMKAVG